MAARVWRKNGAAQLNAADELERMQARHKKAHAKPAPNRHEQMWAALEKKWAQREKENS